MEEENSIGYFVGVLEDPELNKAASKWLKKYENTEKAKDKRWNNLEDTIMGEKLTLDQTVMDEKGKRINPTTGNPVMQVQSIKKSNVTAD